MAGARTSAPSAPLVWIMAWPPYIRSDPRERRDRIVGDGQDDQLDLVEDGLRIGEDAADVDQRAEPLAPAGIPARHRVDRPAGSTQRHAERGADRTGPHDADDRGPARLRLDVRVGMVAGMGGIAVAVEARRRRIEIDARLGDGGLLLRAIPFRIVARKVAPGLHGAPPPAIVGGRRTCIRRV